MQAQGGCAQKLVADSSLQTVYGNAVVHLCQVGHFRARGCSRLSLYAMLNRIKNVLLINWRGGCQVKVSSISRRVSQETTIKRLNKTINFVNTI